jgi:hypothetical protein
MTLRILAAFVSIACVGNPLCLPAQAHTKQPVSGQASSYVPLYTFQLDKDHRTEYPMASPIYEAPLQCSEDGTIFMDMFIPPNFSQEIMFALGPDGKKTSYPFEDIHDLYGVASQNPVSVDAADAGVSFLLYGTRDSAAEFPTAGKAPRYTGERDWYIVRFDRDGSYKGSVPIDIPHFEPARIAEFDTGQYLVLGSDTLEPVPKVAMLDSDGRLRRFLNPPNPLPGNSPSLAPSLSHLNPSMSKEKRHSIQIRQAVLSYQLTHHGNAIDLLEPGSQEPILEVFPDGSVNAIPVGPHPGYDLDSLISSDGKTLLVRFRPTGNKYVEPGEGIIEEIGVTDGTPLKRISFPELSLLDVLCIHDGKAEILRSRKTSTDSMIFDIYQADLVPAPANTAQ